MKFLFCHDTYYARDAKGRIYAHGAFPADLWVTRFLPHCDAMNVMGRAAPWHGGDEKRLPLSGAENVDFILLDNINAPLKRLFGSGAVKRQISDAVRRADGVIIRGPSEIGMIAAKYARKMNKPYAVEMSGCAFDHLWFHGSLLAKLYAPLKYLRARDMVKHAEQVMYVTRDFLQNRYPANGLTQHASNAEIDLPPAIPARKDAPFIIGMVGQYHNNLKGVNIALTALAHIKDQLPAFELRILGDGDTARWKTLIKQYGLERNVIFCPPVPSFSGVCKFLDRLSLYIQPSHHEGLPRALIEAMSRGCPALASGAGGSAELLPPDCIHRKGDSNALAHHILNALDRDWRETHGQQNFETAKHYARDSLAPRRHEFWAGFAKNIQK